MLSVADDSIAEYSNMNLELCVTVVSILDGLQREIAFQSMFIPSGFSQMSKWQSMLHVLECMPFNNCTLY